MKKLLVGLAALILIGLVTKASASPILLGAGTGFFITSDGYMLTNCHVACNSDTTLKVKIGDQLVPAVLVEQVGRQDLAIIKVQLPKGYSAQAVVIDPRDVSDGEGVYAIGFPLSLKIEPPHLTLSHITRSLFGGYIELDGAVYPGSSGSPMFDKAGHAVGVVSAVKIFGPYIAFGANMAEPLITALNVLVKYHVTLAKSFIGIPLNSRTMSENYKSVTQIFVFGEPLKAIAAEHND